MHNRFNKQKLWKQLGGTSGFEVLKDKNLITLNKLKGDGKVVDIDSN